jgi:nucleotide-binding universal stress UspA family protein
MMPRIIVGVEGSVDGRRALRWAVDEARLRGASLEAVHAWQPPYFDAAPLTPPITDLGPYEQAARRLLEREVRSVSQAGLPKPIEPMLRKGAPAAVLVEVAAGAALVVVGCRGLGGLAGLLLGSISHQLSHHAPCPVVIVRLGAPATATDAAASIDDP